MAGRKRLGLREVRALKAGTTIWDEAVPGFGARRQNSEAISYVLFYRNKEGRQRWHTIGRHGVWTPETARDEAKRLLGQVVGGADPVSDKISKRNAKTVGELCDLYLADAEAGLVLKRSGKPKKGSTLACDKGRIESHIKPLIGGRTIASVTTSDIEDLLRTIAEGKTHAKTKTKPRGLSLVKGGKTAANRTVGLLGGIFTYAVRKKLRADNPVRGVIRFEDNQRKRRLSDDECEALGGALRRAEVYVWPAAIAALRLLALTGWRSGEVLSLRWQEVDLARRTATLGDTKTGQSMRPLSRAACDLLKTIPRSGDNVFPPTRGNGQMTGFRKFWIRVAKLGELPPDVTPHTLRHSFSSLAADIGYSESTIAALIGHKGRTVTSRYIHTADAVLLAAADVVADRTAELMGDKKPTGIVVELRSAHDGTVK